MQYSKLDIAGWYISYLQSQNKVPSGEYPWNEVSPNYFSIRDRAINQWFGTRPIQDESILSSLESINVRSIVENKHQYEQSVDTFKNWFPYDISKFDLKFIDGTIEGFNSVLARHRNKTLYALDNEYWYVLNSADQYEMNVQPVTKNSKDGVAIISYPFAFWGEDVSDVIKELKQNGNYVAVDLTYIPLLTRGYTNPFDLGADEYLFSFGKTWPIQVLRSGFRISQTEINDFITARCNTARLPNRMGCGTADFLMQRYDYGYIINKYKSITDNVCELLDLKQTSVLTVAKGNFRHESEYTGHKYNRNTGNRACISALLESYHYLNSKNFKEILNEFT